MAWQIGKSWTPAILQDTLRGLRRFGSDNTLIECKRAGNGVFDDSFESITAFANMPEGGTLLLGIDEVANFHISGVHKSNELESAIANKVRSAIKPSPQLNFFHISLEGATVLAVEVLPLAPRHKPARFKNRAYLRQSDGDYVMNVNDIHMILAEGLHERQREHHDSFIVEGTSVAELDPELKDVYVRNVRSKNTRLAHVSNEDLLLQTAGVTDREGQLRLGGLYSMGYLPTAHFPSLSATAAVRVQRDESGVRNRNLEDFEGPIPLLLEKTMEWVRQNTSQERAYGPSGHMEVRTEFPMSAVRELLANAFVHRDLSPDTVDAGKRVEIRILHDRLIIKSPGGLKGLSKSQLESHVLSKAAVNQRIYEIAKNLETSDGQPIIEGEGGGIPEVFFSMRAAGKPDPLFFDNGVEFTVNLLRASRYSEDEGEWLSGISASLTWIQKEILVGLQRGEQWSRQRAFKDFHLAKPQDVRTAIEGLFALNAIDEVGELFSLVSKKRPVGESKVQEEGVRRGVDLHDVAGLGLNTEVIYRAVESGHGSVAEIVEKTGLSDSQVRYGLGQLLGAKVVAMNGGRGFRNTRYSVLDSSE